VLATNVLSTPCAIKKLFSGRVKALELYLKNTEGEWRKRRAGAEESQASPFFFIPPT
jgi:hypothetical protein